MFGKLALDEDGSLGIIVSHEPRMCDSDREQWVGVRLTDTAFGKAGDWWYSAKPQIVEGCLAFAKALQVHATVQPVTHL